MVSASVAIDRRTIMAGLSVMAGGLAGMNPMAGQPGALAAVAARRGGIVQIDDPIDPSRTAHVVVDLQNGFLAPGAISEVPAARAVVPSVNRISGAVRAAGGLNIFLRFTVAGDDDWSVRLRRADGSEAARAAAFHVGAESWQLWSALDVDAADIVLDKTRYSAFVPGTCDLEFVLRERAIDTLIISGALSNCCCESTARDAMQRNFRVLFITDGNAAVSEAEHQATMFNLGWIFADLYTTDEIVEAIGAASGA